ncbi:MAG TPA: AraC family transcriptional regulator [Polyangiaceae bacterium]|nr:AraC family transcriptional regulator [Polyangiaceae bacterium]
MPPRKAPPLYITPGVARHLVEVAASAGADRPAMLRALGVAPGALDDPDTRLPFEGFARAWELAADALGEGAAPFAVARVLRLEAYGVLGFASLTAPTAREAIERFCRFHRLCTNAAALTLEAPPGRPAYLWWDRGPETGRGFRLIDESVLVNSVAHLRQGVGEGMTPLRVWFRHPAPDDLGPYRRFFGAPVEFGAPRCGLALEASLLDAPLPGANAAMADYFRREIEGRLAHERAGDSFAARVSDVLARELPSGEPSCALVAQRLALSERTLRRRLAEEGTSLRELLDRVRRQRAEALLREGGASVGEAAFLLGFSDASTFSRAYRRWHGVAPARHRRS